jgi:alpha-beta hydrolase superfamily lysophospholipase
MLTALFLLLLVLVLLVLCGTVGLSWFIASKLLHRTGSAVAWNIPIIARDAATITLRSTKNTRRPGVFGITGPQGQAIVGPMLAEQADTVTRELLSLVGALSQKTNVAWNTTVYGGRLRDSLNLPLQEVYIPGALGAMPAWYVPGAQQTWAILVHGATGTREQTLRASKTLASAGLHLLAITYRGDEGAPAAGLSHLGETEWQDLEAAVRYALDHGAQDIVLSGWSLGGTIVELFLRRSQLASHIRAVVLDSPVLNWRATLEALLKKNKLPRFLASVTEKMIAWRTGVQLAMLDLARQDTTQQPLPRLLFHGTADTTAPLAVSDAFAAAFPRVTYHRIPKAEHTQCWNADPAFYEVELRSFLAQVCEKHPV